MKRTGIRIILTAIILITGCICTGGIAFAEEQVFTSAAEINDALESSDSVTGKLGCDIAGKITVKKGKSLTLDFNGYAIKDGSVTARVTNYGTFKAEGGEIITGSGNAIDCQSGTIELTEMKLSSQTGGSAFSSDLADQITIKDSEVVSGESRAMYIDCSVLDISGSKITGGTKGLYANSSTVTVSEDSVITAGSSYAFAIEKYCTAEITDSDIETTAGTDYAPALYCDGEGCSISAENCEISMKGDSSQCAAEIKGTGNVMKLKGCEISGEGGTAVTGMSGKLDMSDCWVTATGDDMFCVDLYNTRADFEANTMFASKGASGIRVSMGKTARHEYGSINVESDGGNGIVIKDGSTFVMNDAAIMTESADSAIVNRNGRLVMKAGQILADEGYALENRGEGAKAAIGYGEFLGGRGFVNKGDMTIVSGEFTFEPDASLLAEGTVLTKEGSFWIATSNKIRSAQELQTAIDSSTGGDTLVLGCDLCVNELDEADNGACQIKIPKDKRVTIDLNGRDIINEADNDREVMNVDGGLTICDSRGTGEVEGINVAYGGDLIMKDGTVFAEEELGTAINSMGNVEIRGGTVRSAGNWAISSSYNRDGLKITGGKFISAGKAGTAILVSNAEADICNAEVEAAGCGIDVTGEGAAARIRNCTVSAGGNAISTGYMASCSVSGGNYTAGGTKAAVTAYQEYANIVINSGTFTAVRSYAVYADDGGGSYTADEMPAVTVNGGIFKSKLGFCGENFIKDGSLRKYEISENCFAVSKIMTKPAKKKITRASGKLTVFTKAKPSACGADKYQISYRLKGHKKWNSTYSTSSKKTIRKLKRKRYYYVKIRAVKRLGDKTFYSGWTKAYRVKTR